MKKSICFLFFMLNLSGFVSGQKYVPFPTENAEWNIGFCSAPQDFQLAVECNMLNYSLAGDTIINNLNYKKVSLNKSLTVGFIREENKKIYYIGSGFTNSGISYSPQMLEKIRACSPSFIKSYDMEYLLYDFNVKSGDDVTWGMESDHVVKIDSVLIGNSYRKRYTLRNYGDVIIEGIGSVLKGLLSSVSPVPMCSDYISSWNHICFSQNGQTVYKNPDYVDCNSTEKWSDKKYFETGDRWTEYIITSYMFPTSYTFVSDKRQYYLGTDTLVNGIHYYNIIEYTPNNLQHPTNHYGIMREENGKVYVNLNNNNTGEFLLYDFTLNVGDTIHSNAPSGPLSNSPVISKIDTIQLMTGEKRKMFHCNEFTYIEGIGCLNGLFGPLSDMCTCDPDIESVLTCFKSGTDEIYTDKYWCADGNCCGVLTDIIEPKADIIRSSLHPNPANDFVKIELSNTNDQCTSVEIMDFQGRKISTLPVSETNGMTIDISKYHAGIYFILVRFANGFETHKLIKL